MRRIILTLILVLLVCIFADISKAELKIEVSISRDKIILGEPANINIIFENTGDKELILPYGLAATGRTARGSNLRILGPERDECRLQVTEWLNTDTPHDTIKANSKGIQNPPLNLLGIVDAGEYEVWYEYDSTKVDHKWDKINASRVKAVSNHIKFELVRPLGIDAKAFEAYRDKCNQMELYGGKRYDLISRFPTSIYAGWSLSRVPFDILVELVGTNKAGNEIIIGMINRDPNILHNHIHLDVPLPPGYITGDRIEWMKKIMGYAEQFIDARSECPCAGPLRARVGFTALALGDFSRACLSFKKSLEMDWGYKDPKIDKGEKEGTESALSILQEKKLCN